MNISKILLVAVAGALVAAFFASGVTEYLAFDSLGASRDWLQMQYETSPAAVVAGYFVIYVAMAVLSIPGAAVMTLLGGAVFGLGVGFVAVSFASTLGATLAFVFARFLFRDSVQRRFGAMLERVNRGVEREGGFYLFALRLVPVFPFFAVNLVMSLTQIRPWTFAWVSQVGMLPGTLAYVNAGRELGSITQAGDILTPGFIGAFTVLGILPLISRRILLRMRAKQVFARFSKPARFDRNLIVIGAGAGGLVSAYIAAAVRASVTLVERGAMGGDCLNTGCVPSKALIRAARHAHDIRTASTFGIDAGEVAVDFKRVMARIREVITKIEPHDSVARYTELGVDCRIGEAKIVSPWCVEIDGVPLTTRSIIVAAGARPFVPPIPGLETVPFLTSDSVWGLEELPASLVVLGGGPIGCELAQSFQRLGSNVAIVEMAPSLLVRDEPEFGAAMRSQLNSDGVAVHVATRAGRVSAAEAGGILHCEGPDGPIELPFEALLVAVGRKPNVEGYGLEELGIPTAGGGVIETDEYLQTLYPNIFACGDVAGPLQFTHTAAHQAYYACVNALFGDLKRSAVDYRFIPKVTYTDPEIASVGLGEAAATEAGIAYAVTRYGIDDLDRAIVDGLADGEVKVLTAAGSDKILGAHIRGAHAGELIAEFTLAMRNNLGLKKILGTVHAYPTMMEANKYAAGQWSRANAPERVLAWLERFHKWRRNG
jgi:pyruvate/2-oxoglutarate dehydrogenase complex dihydrolipoamide dehydrogenase (E3) component/uncharacterized membrane protein YdjX (TVP38/TMEM64 family)